MTDESLEKTPLEISKDIISQLKEFAHYSKTNIEKLSEFWLILDEEMKQKELAGQMEELLAKQRSFHGSLEKLIHDYETECNRIENEGD